jgi:hypothetical protein
MILIFFKKFQNSKDKICTLPLCIGGKHERHSRILLPLAVISTPLSFRPHNVREGLLPYQHIVMGEWEQDGQGQKISLLEYKTYNCLSILNLSAYLER